MLVIRMQRTGRKGHAQFRVVVQDSRRTPTSGKLVASLGHFNPHTKETSLDKEKASFYLEHGAQPSERVVRLLKSQAVKLPNWVEVPDKKSGKTKNIEKRRSTRPPEPKAPQTETPVETKPESTEPPADAGEEQVADSESVDKQTEPAEEPTEAVEVAEPETKDTAPEPKSSAEEVATDEPTSDVQVPDEKVDQTEESSPKSEEKSEKTKEA